MNLIEKLNSWLIISLFFFVSISTAIGVLISLLIFILWILDANFRNQFYEIKSNPVAISSILYFCIFVIGLFWSDNIDSGLEIVEKNWKFLMLPIFMFYVRKEHISLYLNAFIASIFLSESLSYLVWFEVINPFLKATVHDPTIFMSHVVYNPMLAVTIFIVAARLIFDEKRSILITFIETFFLLSMTVNMFITGGRAGQVMFFVVIFILSYRFFKGNLIKFLTVSLIISSTIFTTAYSYSPLFKERVDLAVNGIKNFESNEDSSVGRRVRWAINGLEVFSQNPFFGVGTGDNHSEMEKTHLKSGSLVEPSGNPHNNHLLVAVQLGLFGILPFYWIFYSQIKSSRDIENEELARLGYLIPIFFFIVSLGESYLSVHVTSLFFCAISAVIFAKYNAKPNKNLQKR